MRYDFAAYDGAGHLKVVVEAKRRSATSAAWAAEFRRNLMAHGEVAPDAHFVFVTPDKIYAWNPGARAGALPDADIDARPVFAPYFQRAMTAPTEIAPDAFELLVAWWLGDIARDEDESKRAPLRGTGLAEALAGARIDREVAA